MPVGHHIRDESDARDLFKSLDVPGELLTKRLPEWRSLEKLTFELIRSGRVEVMDWSEDGRFKLPLLGFSFGNPDPAAPALILFGGVHGLERIGAQVVLSLMSTFSEMLAWDHLLQQSLSHIRLAFFPLVNPLGMFHRWRSNPRGVDLMRNAPIESTDNPTWLLGGHRFSRRLPWYRGPAGEELEIESRALVAFAKAQMFSSKRAVSLDFHSGFGMVDQIWFPHATSRKPFRHLPELHALIEMFERTHPHHFYRIEPQAKNYTTHGDLWDYLYDEYQKAQPDGVYLPLTVEMGSWMWVKKNPLQMFSALGPFNPIVPHRLKRILRRHNTLFDFMIRSLVSSQAWVPALTEQRQKHERQALEIWYGDDER